MRFKGIAQYVITLSNLRIKILNELSYFEELG